MKVTAIQMPLAWEDKPANFQTVRRLVTQAEPEPNSLLVLPEMFATGFSMNTVTIAEDYGGPTEQFLSALAVECKSWVLGGAAMRGRGGAVRNKALAFSPEGHLAGYYAKRRPFTPGGESRHHQAGEKPALFRWANCNVSPLVCYDLRFPELFREAAGLWKPELFAVIANWPAKRIHHWVRLLQARAIENQAYVVGVNRIGSDPCYSYAGRSLIIDPQGEILADAGESEGWISAELDVEQLNKYRQGLPFLEDLRLR
jgi:omega-amidase